MNEVNFIEQNEFHIKSRRLLGEPMTPTMISFLLKTGFVKTEKQALFILLSIVVITLSATFFLIYGRNSNSSEMVVDSQGNAYTFEQYIDLVRQGKDPLLPI